MIAGGSIDIYVVGGEIDSSIDFSRLIFAIDITELPDVYANGQILLLTFDFAPLEAWKLYKAVANQSTVFNAGEWMEDTINPYAKSIEAANSDGALAEALADGKITMTASTTAPLTPQFYDIWQCPASYVNIGELSAADAEIMQKNGTNDVYFYWGIDNAWHLTTMPMESSIQDSKSTAIVKSQASVWNTVNVSGKMYINGWQSIIAYQGDVVTKNDFAIIADNFYIGAVGNVVQNGIDANGKPIYESTGEAYKPFVVDTVNHKIAFNGTVSFTNMTGALTTTQQQAINTSNLVNGAGWTTDATANAAQSTANTASANATSALSQLTNIASDNILSPVEKFTVIADKSVIDTEQSGIDAQATAYSITTEKTTYDTAVSTLTTYLATLTTPVLWNNISGDTTIVGTTFRTKFQDVYTARQALLNAIYAAAKSIADSKLSSSSDLAALINSGTTTINGGSITAGTITTGHISTAGLSAGVIKAGIIFNSGGSAGSYTMKIDLDAGSIYIR